MAYDLSLHPERVVAFLHLLEGFTPLGRIRLIEALEQNLGEHGDMFRAKAEMRLAPGSEYFWFDYVADDGTGRWRSLWFLVSDRAAASGVLLVEYVEERTEPVSP